MSQLFRSVEERYEGLKRIEEAEGSGTERTEYFSAIASVGADRRPSVLRRLKKKFPSLPQVDLEDCFQLAWETALRSFPNDNPVRIVRFIEVVAERRAIDLIRRSSGRFVYGDQNDLLEQIHAEGADPHIQVARRDDVSRILALITLLKPRQRQVIVLRLVFALEPEEICATLQLSRKQYEGVFTRGCKSLDRLAILHDHFLDDQQTEPRCHREQILPTSKTLTGKGA